MNNVNFDTKYYYSHLNKWHSILICINVVVLIILLGDTFFNFYDEFKNSRVPSYNPYIMCLIYAFLGIINILGIFYCHYTDKMDWKLLGNEPLYKKILSYKYPFFGSKSDILRLSLSLSLIAYMLSSMFVFINKANFYSFFIQFVDIMLLISSISAIYYVKHPIYKKSYLTLANLIHIPSTKLSVRWNNGILSIMSFVLFAFVFIQLIIVFIMYVINVSGAGDTNLNVNDIGRVHGVIKKINKTKLLKYSNSRSLMRLEPILNKACNNIFIIIFIIMLLTIICIITMAFIYSIRNNISTYRLVCFISELTYYLFKYAVITISSIVVMDKFIGHFEKYPLALNGDIAIVILLFFPFMSVYYFLYTFNSVNKIKC